MNYEWMYRKVKNIIDDYEDGESGLSAAEGMRLIGIIIRKEVEAKEIKGIMGEDVELKKIFKDFVKRWGDRVEDVMDIFLKEE